MEISIAGKFLSLDWMDQRDKGILLDALEEHAYNLEQRIADNQAVEANKRDLDTVEVWIETIENLWAESE